jgi:hypothetical protein
LYKLCGAARVRLSMRDHCLYVIAAMRERKAKRRSKAACSYN